MSRYHCDDCDHTFDAPTDTETCRCGCGERAWREEATDAIRPTRTEIAEQIRVVRAAQDDVDALLAAAPSAPADRTARRDQYAAAMARRDGHPWPTEFEDDERDYRRRADAAIAIADIELAAEVAHLRGLLTAENKRANDAIDREEAAEQAVEEARAGQNLRDRIAYTLAAADGWTWATGFDPATSTVYQGYLKRADAVLAALPAPADRAAEDAKELADLDREGAELVCVDECGSCDACGFEPFGTPAEGWREAARFLRRTPRDSADFLGAIRGARLIETELRRRADEAQQAGESRG